MAAFSCFSRSLFLTLVITFSLTGLTCEQIDQNHDKQQQVLIKNLSIKQGIGNFTQKKHFKFLSQPIRSQGSFVVSKESALWQTETPVFSQLLVKPNAIYQRLSISDTYQPLFENAELSSVLTTIFKGQVNPDDWSLLPLIIENTSTELMTEKTLELKQQKCITLEPKSQQLSQIFKLVNLCLLDKQTRQIDLLDNQDNKTEILMSLISNELSIEHLNSLKSE